MPDSFATEIRRDEPLDGIGSWLDALDPSVSDQDAVTRLEAESRGAGIVLPSERGFSDVLSRTVARLRGREQLDDLGEAPSSFDLLALHVPPGGRAALQIERQRASEQTVSVQALGFGYGSGRKLTVALKDDIAERDTCMRVLQHVIVRVRRFKPSSGSSEPVVTTDVVGWGQRELAAWPDCPLCGLAGEPDPFRFDIDLEHAIDLRRYDEEFRRDVTYLLSGERKTDIGMSVSAPGGIALNAGFHLKQETSVSCGVSYSFAPKRFYQPYRPRGDEGTLPAWLTS